MQIRDSFIDERYRPKNRVVKASVLDFLWSYEDENSQPTPEMYQKAYNSYNLKLKASCFRIRRVLAMSLLRVVFDAWHSVAVDAMKTKEYFERIERGEIIDSAYEGFFRVRTDGKDEISSLPKHVALRGSNGGERFKVKQSFEFCATLPERYDKKIEVHGDISGFARHLTSATNKVAANVIHKCRPFLGHLNLRGCYNLTSESIKLAVDLSIALVNYRVTEIWNLTICNTLSHQVTEEGYRFISRGCSTLTTIILNQLPGLRDDCIQALTSECRTLKNVSILNSPLLSDAAFKCLASCRRLNKIRVEGNNRLTDASLKVLARSCPLLQHVYFVDCPRMTDLALKALATSKHLLVVNVADCVRIQDTGVRQIVEGSSGAKLKELNLTNCVRVSDVTLLRIAQRCHNLVYASFCYCDHVTDAGVELLGTLPSLMSLDLSGCNIQDQGVAALGNNPRFRDITLAECPNITDLGLQVRTENSRE
ncbi:F-box/LRR-repeat protein 13 [Stylophora pistillata]|uniref:F-box/LRR-repeat protein 13 n=1 Tax=Stylophora pistillata TaxID=50429 RepID=A0A2B4RGB3_STYPI|nr:F-box/LRR-repeat protein 13 [Stylophora pistillata]